MRVIQERDGSNDPLVSYTRGNDLSTSMEGAGGIGGLLARSSGYSGGNFTTHNYYFCDGNGNITCMLDNSPAKVASYRYDPFGNTISSSGTLASANVYRFSSKEIHANSGMYYYGYRFYDPNLQRWINRDPLNEAGFEMVHLVTQPPEIRGLLVGVQFFSSEEVMASYLAVLKTIHDEVGSQAPNWPAELLQSPNLYGYVNNSPLVFCDYEGLFSLSACLKNGLLGGFVGGVTGGVVGGLTGAITGGIIGTAGGPPGQAAGVTYGLAKGGIGGAIGGAVGGAVLGCLTGGDCFNPKKAALQGLKAGAISGLGAGLIGGWYAGGGTLGPL